MKDPIEREDAIEVVSLSCRTCLARNAEDCEKCSIPKLRELINAISSTDSSQGEWIPATWQDEQCPERLKRHKCSRCGQRAKQILVKTELVDNYYCNKAEPITEYTHEEQLSNFCPNCGAKMKRSE